ncbi:uncharacterized protein LOC112563141 [Pomacea canaliculata]|nr:uncharacterized protein LOC112563141 [Pomacea canaliculata]
MASLVAEYGDDSSSCDSEHDCNENDDTENGSRNKHMKQETLAVNFFTDTGKGDSGDSDTDSIKNLSSPNETNESDTSSKMQKLPSPFQFTGSVRLPNPSLSAKANEGCLLGTEEVASSSVFVNPYEQEELTRLGILEKHVRLTEAAPQRPATKQICWKFKKGRCHLGDRCRFFHDMSNIFLGGCESGSSKNKHRLDGSVAPQQDSASVGQELSAFRSNLSAGQSADTQSTDDSDSCVFLAKRKKRHGVTDALQPPKKAMDSLNKMRQREHPWTIKK